MPHLELQDALVQGWRGVGHQRCKIVRQVVRSAADDLQEGLCSSHLPSHVPRQGSRNRFIGSACRMFYKLMGQHSILRCWDASRMFWDQVISLRPEVLLHASHESQSCERPRSLAAMKSTIFIGHAGKAQH